MPVTFHSDAGDFSLDLTADISVRPMHCTLCDGHGTLGRDKSRAECRCGVLARWAIDSAIPIEYDSELNEYHLMHKVGQYQMIYFCPSCGGRTPESKCEDLFTNPSQTEIESLSARVKGANTLDEVVRILGDPDERDGPITHSAEEKRIYGMKDVKSSLVYRRLSKTVCLIVQEYEDGLGFAFMGQYKQKPKRFRFLSWLKRILSADAASGRSP